MKNISRLFYKQYFTGISFTYLLVNNAKVPDPVKQIIKLRNEEILNADLFIITRNELVTHCVLAKVAYPGVVTGIGIHHETGIEGEFKLGMHFDYTYGMPVIYGSSVKGLLRNAFPDEKEIIEIFNCKVQQIRTYLGEGFEEVDVIKLRDVLFEGKESDKMLPMNNRDVFFDAVVVATDSKGRLLERDSITPHGINPLKNPTPLAFLKIASGVKIEFRFRLHNCQVNGLLITKEKINILFKMILADYGIGAKTNVGYGQFSELKCEVINN